MEAVDEYFFCEASGYNPSNPCPKNYEQYTYPELQAAIYVVMGFIPTVNLIYVLNVKQMRKEISEIFPSMSAAFSKTNLNSSPNSSNKGKQNFSLDEIDSLESKNWPSTQPIG